MSRPARIAAEGVVDNHFRLTIGEETYEAFRVRTGAFDIYVNASPEPVHTAKTWNGAVTWLTKHIRHSG